MIWAGCTGEVATAAALADACGRAVEPLGVPKDERHPFVAHITLGRAKEGREDRALADAIRTFPGTAFGKLRIEAVTLFRSEPRPEGPRYTVIERIPLAAKP